MAEIMLAAEGQICAIACHNHRAYISTGHTNMKTDTVVMRDRDK